MPIEIDGDPWLDQEHRQVRYWLRIDSDKMLCAVELSALQERFLAHEAPQDTPEERYLLSFGANAPELLTRTLDKIAQARDVPPDEPAILLETSDFPF